MVLLAIKVRLTSIKMDKNQTLASRSLKPCSVALLLISPCSLLVVVDQVGVPMAWRRLSHFSLRPGQEETAAALATGKDVLAYSRSTCHSHDRSAIMTMVDICVALLPFSFSHLCSTHAESLPV